MIVTTLLLLTACSVDQKEQRQIKEDNKTIIHKSCLDKNISNFRKSVYNVKAYLTGDPSCDENKSTILHYARALDEKCKEIGCFDVNASSINKKINSFFDDVKRDYENFQKKHSK